MSLSEGMAVRTSAATIEDNGVVGINPVDMVNGIGGMRLEPGDIALNVANRNRAVAE